MPWHASEWNQSAGRPSAPRHPDVGRIRTRGIIRAALDPDAMSTARVLHLAGRALEAIWNGDADQFERLCTKSVSIAFTSAEHSSGVVRPSELLCGGNALSAIEVHLDHVLYVHPSIAVSFRIAARAGASRGSDGSGPHDVTVSGALFGLVSEDSFAELQLIHDSALVRSGPSSATGPASADRRLRLRGSGKTPG